MECSAGSAKSSARSGRVWQRGSAGLIAVRKNRSSREQNPPKVDRGAIRDRQFQVEMNAGHVEKSVGCGSKARQCGASWQCSVGRSERYGGQRWRGGVGLSSVEGHRFEEQVVLLGRFEKTGRLAGQSPLTFCRVAPAERLASTSGLMHGTFDHHRRAVNGDQQGNSGS